MATVAKLETYLVTVTDEDIEQIDAASVGDPVKGVTPSAS